MSDAECLTAILTTINLKSENKAERIERLGNLRKLIDEELSAVAYTAPPGQTWVCGACGRENRVRTRVGDESCFLNAVLCEEGSIERDATGRLVNAKAAKP